MGGNPGLEMGLGHCVRWEHQNRGLARQHSALRIATRSIYPEIQLFSVCLHALRPKQGPNSVILGQQPPNAGEKRTMHDILVDSFCGRGHGALPVPAPERLLAVSGDFGLLSACFVPRPVRTTCDTLWSRYSRGKCMEGNRYHLRLSGEAETSGIWPLREGPNSHGLGEDQCCQIPP